MARTDAALPIAALARPAVTAVVRESGFFEAGSVAESAVGQAASMATSLLPRLPVHAPSGGGASAGRPAARVGDPVGSHGASAPGAGGGGAAARAVMGLALPIVGPLAGSMLGGLGGVVTSGLGAVLRLVSGNPSLAGGCARVASGSSNVFIEGRAVARGGDDRHSHGANARLVEGSATVFVNGRPLVRVGDRASCSGVVTSGAARTIIGGGSTSAGNGGRGGAGGPLAALLRGGLMQIASNQVSALIGGLVPELPAGLSPVLTGALRGAMTGGAAGALQGAMGSAMSAATGAVTNMVGSAMSSGMQALTAEAGLTIGAFGGDAAMLGTVAAGELIGASGLEGGSGGDALPCAAGEGAMDGGGDDDGGGAVGPTGAVRTTAPTEGPSRVPAAGAVGELIGTPAAAPVPTRVGGGLAEPARIPVYGGPGLAFETIAPETPFVRYEPNSLLPHQVMTPHASDYWNELSNARFGLQQEYDALYVRRGDRWNDIVNDPIVGIRGDDDAGSFRGTTAGRLLEQFPQGRFVADFASEDAYIFIVRRDGGLAELSGEPPPAPRLPPPSEPELGSEGGRTPRAPEGQGPTLRDQAMTPEDPNARAAAPGGAAPEGESGAAAARPATGADGGPPRPTAPAPAACTSCQPPGASEIEQTARATGMGDRPEGTPPPNRPPGVGDAEIQRAQATGSVDADGRLHVVSDDGERVYRRNDDDTFSEVDRRSLRGDLEQGVGRQMEMIENPRLETPEARQFESRDGRRFALTREGVQEITANGMRPVSPGELPNDVARRIMSRFVGSAAMGGPEQNNYAARGMRILVDQAEGYWDARQYTTGRQAPPLPPGTVPIGD